MFTRFKYRRFNVEINVYGRIENKSIFRDYVGPEDDNLVTLAVYAQEESLLQQLQWGVRSLDIRIGYCKV
jgi:hypothetical protein